MAAASSTVTSCGPSPGNCCWSAETSTILPRSVGFARSTTSAIEGRDMGAGEGEREVARDESLDDAVDWRAPLGPAAEPCRLRGEIGRLAGWLGARLDWALGVSLGARLGRRLDGWTGAGLLSAARVAPSPSDTRRGRSLCAGDVAWPGLEGASPSDARRGRSLRRNEDAGLGAVELEGDCSCDAGPRLSLTSELASERRRVLSSSGSASAAAFTPGPASFAIAFLLKGAEPRSSDSAEMGLMGFMKSGEVGVKSSVTCRCADTCLGTSSCRAWTSSTGGRGVRPPLERGLLGDRCGERSEERGERSGRFRSSPEAW
mmetsp:Transcript_6941/g.17739  ORF Transcript_6941/g.17739 Transcript_6941/m.17739 type:complete len:317 (-) Transcript_6941:271-1221(-)